MKMRDMVFKDITVCMAITEYLSRNFIYIFVCMYLLFRGWEASGQEANRFGV